MYETDSPVNSCESDREKKPQQIGPSIPLRAISMRNEEPRAFQCASAKQAVLFISWRTLILVGRVGQALAG